MDEAGQKSDYSHVKKIVRDFERLCIEIYNWQNRALNNGYDIPDMEYEHLRDINFRLTDPQQIRPHVESLIEDINFQEEVLEIIETTHPRIYNRALNAYRTKKIMKE